MATKKHKPDRPKKVTVLFHDHDLVARIDEWGTRNQRHTRSNAVEALVALALSQAQAQAQQQTRSA